MKIKTAFGRLMIGLLLLAGLSVVAVAQATLPIPAGLAPGDQYRLVFWTSQTTVATSTDIAYYNNFVMNSANGPSSRVAYLNATWKVIGSTAAVDARDNTGTNPLVYGSGVPIYDLGGRKVADNYFDLWDGSLDNGIKFNELLEGGFQYSGLPVWTGSFQDGTRGACCLHVTYPLGSSQPFYGYNDFPTERWIWALPGLPTSSLPLYAMSGEFTVPGSGPTASAGGPYSGDFGSDIGMSGASASDPDAGDTLTYSWSVNSASCSFDDASVLNPNLTCNATGNFTATLEVSDGVNPPVSSNAAVMVNKANQTITFGGLANKTYGDGTFVVSATADSGLPVSFEAVGFCTVAAGTITITGVGSCTIRASQAGNGTYNPASNVDQTFTIGKAAATTTVTCPAGSYTYTGAAQTPCSASVAGPGGLSEAPAPVYSSNTNAGTANASYTYAESANYLGSSDSENFTINKAGLIVTPDAQQILIGSPDPTFSFSYSGFVNGENPGVVDTAPTCGVTGVHTGVGSYTITCTGGVDNNYGFTYGTATLRVIYNFNGFLDPIDNLNQNSVKAGQGIPVKFSLNGNFGLNILAAGYPVSYQIQCSGTGDNGAEIPTVTAGNSSLSYDATTDQYNYVWKSDKSWQGTCRVLVVRLNDGSFHTASFKFK